jgi:two-component system phosphate regulon sensor histidine kinase PhoR
MLDSVLTVMTGIVPISAAAMLLRNPTRNPDSNHLRLAASIGLPDAQRAQFQTVLIDGSPFEPVVRYAQPVHLDCPPAVARDDRDVFPERAHVQSDAEACICLPLLAGGTVVGVLALYGDQETCAAVDVHALMPLSNQIGFAVANVRLHQDSDLERYRLQTVLNSIAEGVILCDGAGRLILANQAATRLLTLETMPVAQSIPEMSAFFQMRDTEEQQPLGADQVPMARALAGETFHNYRVIVNGISGDQSIMSFSGAPLYNDHDSIDGAVVVFRDITQLEQAERAKDAFLAEAAHELRSPLAAVRNYAHWLRQRWQRAHGNTREHTGMTLLWQQLSSMLRMVDSLLDISRLDAGQIELQTRLVNLVSLATQVINLQSAMTEGHTLVLDAAAAEIWVPCDEMRIQQVLTNLVGNAVKYSPPGTQVTVQLGWQAAPAGNDPAPPSAAQSAGEALVCVRDEGIGIGPEQQQRLFERFYRANKYRVEGLGLGLYLSYQFVRMHHGHMWVESAEGAGSAFFFTLPFSAPHER